jgi:hypothetical protein
VLSGHVGGLPLDAGRRVSLDVSLLGRPVRVSCACSSCDNEHTRVVRPTLFTGAVTHNLIPMAEAAGIYMAMWRPEEIGIVKAAHLTGLLRAGIAEIEACRERLEMLNPRNGHGSYSSLVAFVRRYLAACIAHPDAEIEVSR